jgi:sigma-B regulation protein RsbU (phosphoserine phosphatase)
MLPAKEVGGDLYDYFFLDPNRLAIVIGDVSGKGVPAALFMAVSRTLLRATAQQKLSPGECLQYVNETLALQNSSSMFVTLFYAILDVRTGELQFANGGHNPPYVISGGAVRELQAKPGGMLVGLIDAAAYKTTEDRLAPGDVLLLFTDGVSEAVRGDGEFYGEQRLEKFLAARCATESMEHLVTGLHAEVFRFADGEDQADDITVVGLRYKGPVGV